MESKEPEIPPVKSLGDHVRTAWRRMNVARPLSFYLLFAILAVVLLGAQIIHVREDPKRYALFLALNFAFFMVIIFLALLDCIGIIKAHFSERERLFRTTLGESEFVDQLRQRVPPKRDKS